MCGIAGLVNSSADRSEAQHEALVRVMADRLAHRGPDDRGTWSDVNRGVALAHTRLSILDVSPCGHQPMASRNTRHVVVFNGEIYNFQQIRARLESCGHSFRGTSDTEVLVEAISEGGVDAALSEAVGMYAFAVWDRHEGTLTLARDRMGEKPLYYGWIGSTFVFASELKALRAHPGWQGAIDRDALTLYLRHGYLPGPHTIYAGIHKLPPACRLRLTQFVPGMLPTPEPYWRLGDESAEQDHAMESEGDAVATLERLLRRAVQQQMVADVPLGAFLSGGIDSTTVVAMMQAVSSRPVRTFTIGLENPDHSEADAARAIACHLGTDHTELVVRPDDALEVIPRLSAVYDEPFADSSQIPTLLVSQLARRSVTVSLSGDGGDELFGGYATYERGAYIARYLSRIPTPLRAVIGRALLSRTVVKGLKTSGKRSSSLLADRAARLGEMLQQRSPMGIHRALYTHWHQPGGIVVGGVEPSSLFTSLPHPWPSRTFAERMLLMDASTYLPDDLLVKVDRAAMSVGLETRVPMLDHRIVEFAMRLPWNMKVRDGVRKWILRQVLYRHVPRHLVDRPKRGFSVPVGEWLRGPLQGWAAQLLDTDRIAAEGFFRPQQIQRRWHEHQRGVCDWSSALWTILMFQSWLGSVTH